MRQIERTIGREEERHIDTLRSRERNQNSETEDEAAALAAAAGPMLRQNHRHWRWWLVADPMMAGGGRFQA